MSRSFAYLSIYLLCHWAVAGTLDDADLGRLFFNPEERFELNHARLGTFDGQSFGDTSKTIRLDGILQRPGKPAVLWVNGKQLKSSSVAGTTVQTASNTATTLVVYLPDQPDAQGILKVGQTLDPANGNVHEAYQRPTQSARLLLKRLAERAAKSPEHRVSKKPDPRSPKPSK
ncbi:hypothetical protein [Chitinimonas sp. BJB300]|uniref:hypothetical protein n=1 Tax=Chitinimonas sp. BJB300 TaxID=1559339 RepID=UPI000C0EC1B9|nr:hypothetical protein [Chitinimonas sp. BJB300]PHV11073.1 hypothetical protein CSQ89_12870 [Chitinimonas sp. BJB300]TSJ91520.1 hypothetical protein FG002_004415 [Chitinimonas sp. BJB300]